MRGMRGKSKNRERQKEIRERKISKNEGNGGERRGEKMASEFQCHL